MSSPRRKPQAETQGITSLRPPSHPPLKPPGQYTAGNDTKPSFAQKWLIPALFLILFLAAAVIFILPPPQTPDNLVQTSSAAALDNSPPPPTQQNPEDPAGQLAAENIEQQWFAQKARAELDNMPQWGGKDYQMALAAAERGHKQLASIEFTPAIKSFENAFKQIYALDKAKENILQKALTEGQNAINQLKAEEAAKNFTLALAIEPTNDQASSGAQRAATLNQVIAMQQEAKSLLKAGKLTEGRQVLLQINQIDPQFTAAQQLLQDTDNRLTRRYFDEAMGIAIAALARQDFSLSHTYLQKAAQLLSKNEAVRELKKRLQEAEKAHILKKLLARAEKHRGEEEWVAATRQYKNALNIAPLSVAATQGLAQAEQRLALQRSLEKIIKQPNRLQEKAPMQDAQKTLHQAKAIKMPGPSLQALIVKTASVIEQAAQPLTITIFSDKQTEVTILRLGRLGKFQKKIIRLKPGNYTITGSRPGYREVRRNLQLLPTGSSKFTIICKEQI